MGKGKAKRGGVNATGRSTTATTRFTRLDHGLLITPAFSALTPASRSLLVELATIENNQNNGAIWLSVDDAAARMGVSDRRVAMAAFDQLEHYGFIVMTRGASFDTKTEAIGPRARCWRLTWVNAFGRVATHEYRDARPCDRRDIRRMDRRQTVLKAYGYRLSSQKTAGEDSALLAVIADLAGTDSALLHRKKPSLSVLPRGADSSHYTADTMGVGEASAQDRACWWQGKVLADLDAARNRRIAQMAVAA